MATQSSSATLENYLPAMDYLLGVFEQAKVQYKDDPFMASRVNSAWSKLDKYYTKTNNSAAYIAALVLDPCLKWEYITSAWQPEWIPDAKALVTKLWKKYRPSSDSTTVSSEIEQSNQNVFITWKHQQSARRADNTDEYFRYIREPPVPQDHIKQGAYSWWLEERQQRLYPNLSKMALDILTIPAMSAAPERLFSSANITISDRRNRLHGDTTEAIECLKSWRKLKSSDDIKLRLDQVIS
jgi:hAT family C-terminal dimerisation region